jgi:Fur family transcriptional regulator, ferric uptake regulator
MTQTVHHAARDTVTLNAPDAEKVGQRSTRQRRAVLAALAQDPDFTSAQALHQQLLERGERIGLTTVYRTLHALASAGLVDTVREGAGQQRFRARPTPEHQHYLVCRQCGNNQPVTSTAVECWARTVARDLDFAEVEHVIELTGICADCQHGRGHGTG